MKPRQSSGYRRSSPHELDTRDFYRSIEPFDDFEEAFNPSRYHAVPEDWFIGIADIKGSTSAIRDNRYKEVNIVGASGGYALAAEQMKHQERLSDAAL